MRHSRMEDLPRKQPSPISRIAEELKHIGDINVTDWDFVELLRKDVGDLEFSQSLRRLGSIRVTDWDFGQVLPAVDRIAHKEVDLCEVFRRTANYRVTDWEFRDILHRNHHEAARAPVEPADPAVMPALASRLDRFLTYLVEQLVDRPEEAEVEVVRSEPGVLTAKLVLARRDAATFIGRGGHSADTVRRILQMAGLRHGVHVLLRVLSQDEADAETGDRGRKPVVE